MRIRGIRRKLYLMVYDKPTVNKKALQFQKSLGEVKQTLGALGRHEKRTENGSIKK